MTPALWLLGGALSGAVAGFFWARRGRAAPACEWFVRRTSVSLLGLMNSDKSGEI
ncbi:MAG: hypothetical protein CM15mP103_09830 [Gammaproteobacteria bacterium]|nr:MAG: hypothetical protein CM15mP103_09830 [Gammaproteobacteria bacterium]